MSYHTSKKMTLEQALAEFRADCPDMPDYRLYQPEGFHLTRQALVEEWDNTEEFVRDDGRTYETGGDVGLSVSVLDKKGEWQDVALWSSYYRGGLGI